jgi:hypothetical protein
MAEVTRVRCLEGDPTADLFARQLITGLWSDGDESSRGLLVATLRALRILLNNGFTRESASLARYGVQLAKAAAAAVPLLASADAALASSVVAALLVLVPSPRAQRDLERTADVMPAVKQALGDTIALHRIACA